MIRRLAASLFVSLFTGLLVAGSAAADEIKIPYDKLEAEAGAYVRRVVEQCSFTVALPHEDVRSDLLTYDFMLDRLPLTARIVRGFNLGKYVIHAQKPGMVLLDDREGVKTRMTQLVSEPGLRLYYSVGYYDGPVLPKLRSTAVILLTYRPIEGGKLATDANIWFRIESPGYRVLSAFIKPTARAEVRKKSVVFINAAKVVAERCAADPVKFRDELRGLSTVKPEEIAELEERLLRRVAPAGPAARAPQTGANAGPAATPATPAVPATPDEMRPATPPGPGDPRARR